VLVDGDQTPHDDTPDDPHARFDLLRVLGQAVVAARADIQTFIVGSQRGPRRSPRWLPDEPGLRLIPGHLRQRRPWPELRRLEA